MENNTITWIIAGVIVLFLALAVAVFIIWGNESQSGVTIPTIENKFYLESIATNAVMGITQPLDGVTFAQVVGVSAGSPQALIFTLRRISQDVFEYHVVRNNVSTNLVLGGIDNLNGITGGVFIGDASVFTGAGRNDTWEFVQAGQLWAATQQNRVIAATPAITYQEPVPTPVTYTWRKIAA